MVTNLTSMARKLLRRALGRSAPEADANRVRQQVASRFLHGEGIEVGALHSPLWIPSSAKVRYVDRLSVADLRLHYPELSSLPLVEIDIIDDGEKLETIAAESQDFVIANHFLEHTQDPIGTMKRHVAVLKPGGVLYTAVPDKRWTFDMNRPETSLDHLIKDHDLGPAWSYEDHVREYAGLVDCLAGQALEDRVRFIKETAYSIHFHVWSASSYRAFLEHLCGPAGLPLEIVHFQTNPGRAENIAVMRRT